jgi:sporulation protein YlmC with PRC-barrel domain
MAGLEKMDPFVKTTFIEERVSDRNYGYGGGIYGMGSYFYVPYVTPKTTVYAHMEKQQIPPGELAVRRGTRVEATDGYVGHVDEFVVNPENGHITHLVMREGHLWGQKDVIIPVSAMAAMGKTVEDTVVLTLDKRQVESLPTFPVNRRWS